VLCYYPLALNILCVSYFVTSITMPNPQSSDMCHMWHQVALASCEFHS